MKTHFPEPTTAEFETLELHITNWRNREPVERAICLAVLRGVCYVTKISEHLGLEPPIVEAAAQKLIGNGLLWDNHKLLLH